MSSSNTLTGRPMCKEDLLFTSNNQPATPNSSNQTVLGAGTVGLTPIDALIISNLVQASSDSAAAALGVPVGAIYYNTSDTHIHARLS